MNKRKIKVVWLRTMRWFKKSLMKEMELTDDQKMGVRIFERCVAIKDAEIFLSPLSDTIYIEVNDIYVTLEYHDLYIINGKFRYDLTLPDKVRSRLRSRVYGILERRREDIEKRIKSKNDRTLSNILSEVEEIRVERNH